MFVKTRKEAKTVLSRQVSSSLLSSPGHRDGSRLTARSGEFLEDFDLKSTAGQLVGRGQSPYASPQDGHSGAHAVTSAFGAAGRVGATG